MSRARTTTGGRHEPDYLSRHRPDRGRARALHYETAAGLLVNLLIGIVGAVAGGLLAGLLGIAAYGLIGQTVVATVGAIICIWVWERIR
jgi:uncharacterized membrane protein YeaQ/YmgE (transglycosylase-associated protein family)